MSAIRRNSESYEHISPEIVGNEQRVLVSDLSGRSNLEYKAKQLGLDVDGRADELASLLSQVKELHPDRGGDTRAMVRLNQARDAITPPDQRRAARTASA